MANWQRILVRAGIGAMLIVSCITLLQAAETKPAAPMFTPLFKKAPVIDGRIAANEWRESHGFEGFGYEGRLNSRRVRGFVGATADTIYVAIQSQLPDEGKLVTELKRDTLSVVYDDAVEVFINPTPNAADNVDYQFLANSANFSGYNVHKNGVPKEMESWRGNWKHACGFDKTWWTFECAIPITSMREVAKGRKTTSGVWLINLCRDWKNAWEWSSLSGGYSNTGLLFAFTDKPTPAVQLHSEGHAAFLPNKQVLSVYNPSGKPLSVNAKLHIVRNNDPEIDQSQVMKLGPGEIKALTVPLEAFKSTVLEMTATVIDTGSNAVYYARDVRWERSDKKPRWVAGAIAKKTPVNFRFAYYPTKSILRLEADISGLAKNAKPTQVLATVREHWTGKEIKTVEYPLGKFKDGLQEKIIELPQLEGNYDIVLKAAGENVPAQPVIQHFERKRFPWENLPTGRSPQVYAPFTPIVVEGKTLSTVLRRHTLNDLGLLDQVEATSANTGIAAPILGSPMRYTVKTAGKDVPVKAEPMRVVSAQPNQVVTEGSITADALKANWKDTWDYDGCVKVELTLLPTNGKAIDALTLEMPFSDATAPLIHANSDRIRAPIAQKVPEGTGVVWNGSQVACDDYIPNFCPYIYLGSGVRGLCWFAENDKGWGWNPATPNMEVVREGGKVLLRIHLINRPTVIDKPRTITFGLLAAPVKPPLNTDATNPNWWRHRYQRDRYWLVGTDINWFGPYADTSGPVYPVGQDLYLWEMLAKGNKKALSQEEIEAFTIYGRKHWSGANVAIWDAHARYNLRIHSPTPDSPGHRMVFYYNRSSGGAGQPEEFRTFKHEWSSIDYGEGGYLAPPESYINFNLYWYARSFEIGNNKGVYVDNWWFSPVSNIIMTEAYKRSDGTVVPATGVWALREWQKRTFIMMNERGITPITMPHITSFNPLPMTAFATVNYDWEWKYSLGDVQDRYSRELLQLISTGELAGTWPVPLGEWGAQTNDPWTQRTFAAVRILHGLDGTYGAAIGPGPLFEPVFDILDKPGTIVYRYWEDRPQPVVTTNPDVPTIVYSVPGQEALVAVVSYSRQDENVTVKLDLKTLGLAEGCSATDLESGEKFAVTNGSFTLPIKKHDIRELRFAK